MNSFLKLKNLLGNTNVCYVYIKSEKRHLWVLNKCDQNRYSNSDIHCLYTASCYNKKRFNIKNFANVQRDVDLSYYKHRLGYNRSFCTKSQCVELDSFGELSNKRYEHIELDEDEDKEEKESEKHFAKRAKSQHRYSETEYFKLIRMYVEKQDIPLMLNTLHLMEVRGQHPSISIYKLIFSSLGIHGHVNASFKIFKKLVANGQVLPASILTSLIIACKNCSNRNTAVEHLDFLRKYVLQNNIKLNDIHYHSFIKAYGHQNQFLTAFSIADEAKDHGLVSEKLVEALFIAAIKNKDYGLRYALSLWHKMKRFNMQRSVVHYNLMLTAIKQTTFGNIKISGALMSEIPEVDPKLTDEPRPDLLGTPPTLSHSIAYLVSGNETFKPNDTTIDMSIDSETKLLAMELDKILELNRLYLFGGVETILKRMEEDNAKPNIITFTILLDLIPPTIEAENNLLSCLNNCGINVDILLFNNLIVKRSRRKDYSAAKDVLNLIQQANLKPDIMTFGALALGCNKVKDGVELLEQMDNIGYLPNDVVLKSLLRNACISQNYGYVKYVMHYISKNGIEPSNNMLHTLRTFDKIMYHRAKSDRRNLTGYNKFKMMYEQWKEMVEKS